MHVQSKPPPTQPTTAGLPIPDTTPQALENPKPVDPQDRPASGPELQPLLAPTLGLSPSPQPEAAVSSNPSTAADSEDPERTVQSFVEQNQKVAETQLKNLRNEEAKLRARLQKVEAGIKRWEVLVDALTISKNGSAGSSVPRFRAVSEAVPETPDVLDAIPKSRIGPPSAIQKK